MWAIIGAVRYTTSVIPAFNRTLYGKNVLIVFLTIVYPPCYDIPETYLRSFVDAQVITNKLVYNIDKDIKAFAQLHNKELKSDKVHYASYGIETHEGVYAQKKVIVKNSKDDKLTLISRKMTARFQNEQDIELKPFLSSLMEEANEEEEPEPKKKEKNEVLDLFDTTINVPVLDKLLAKGTKPSDIRQSMSRITRRKKLIGAAHVHIAVIASVPYTFQYTPTRVREVIGLATDDVNVKIYNSLTRQKKKADGMSTTTSLLKASMQYTLKNAGKALTRMALSKFGSINAEHTSSVYVMNEELISPFRALSNMIRLELNICCDENLDKEKNTQSVKHLGMEPTEKSKGINYIYERLKSKWEHEHCVDVDREIAKMVCEEECPIATKYATPTNIGLMKNAIAALSNPSPVKKPLQFSESKTLGIRRFYYWLHRRLVACVRYVNPTIETHNKDKLCAMFIHRLSLLTKPKCRKALVPLVLCNPNTGKTTFKIFISELFKNRVFDVHPESNTAFQLTSFKSKCPLDIWVDHELTDKQVIFTITLSTGQSPSIIHLSKDLLLSVMFEVHDPKWMAEKWGNKILSDVATRGYSAMSITFPGKSCLCKAIT